MITRDFSEHAYCAGDLSAPPPLHVYSPEAQHAAWHPLAAPYPDMPASHVMIQIPQPGPGDALGDDPTNPECGRMRTTGMIGRFHPTVGGQ
jgi:hypothetical protein